MSKYHQKHQINHNIYKTLNLNNKTQEPKTKCKNKDSAKITSTQDKKKIAQKKNGLRNKYQKGTWG